MKNFTYLVLAMLMGMYSQSLMAQQGDRLRPYVKAWIQNLNEFDARTGSISEAQALVDSLDQAKFNHEEWMLVIAAYNALDMRLLKVYGHPNEGYLPPSTVVYVGGMECSKCSDLVRKEMLALDDVAEVKSVDLKEDLVVFSFPINLIELGNINDRVIPLLKERLPQYDILGGAECQEAGARRKGNPKEEYKVNCLCEVR